MRGHSGQQGGRPPIGEAALGEAGDRGDPDPAKLGDGQRMLGGKGSRMLSKSSMPLATKGFSRPS
ncbi:hypothetical protein I552_0388 [Mycobacterium xenopi 3993]|nr:hypothetical protein I552_0388 [Mycobacterium xenopi 3993]